MTPPEPSTAELEQVVGRLRAMNDQLAVFHAARLIAENTALLSSKAIEQIRQLYTDYDRKHPGAGQ